MEILLNGAPLRLPVDPLDDWNGWRRSLEAELATRGWQLHGISIDGVTVDSLEAAPALEPDGSCLEVTAGPAEVEPADLLEQLRQRLPAFRERFTAIGEAFSRGQWREQLAELGPLLAELQLTREGILLAAQSCGAEGLPDENLAESGQAGFGALLEELVPLIQEQAWVEVSDLLLYELVPLLEQWETTLGVEE